MLILIILIIILIIIIIIKCINNKIIEGYDARYTDTTFELCAEFCKTTENCYGFGYDKKNKICYPSQLPILDISPTDSIFKDEYSNNNAKCNKITPIDSPNDNPPFIDRRSNAVYVCTESNDKQPQYYFHNNNTFKNIGSGKNIDDIFDVENYKVKSYNWPRNKFDYEQLDLLKKEKESHTIVSNNVTNLNNIINYTPLPPKEETITIVPKVITKPQLDFGISNKLNNMINFLKKLKPNILIPKKQVIKSNHIINNYITYTQHNNENNGEYLLDHKCNKNIPSKDCIEYCNNTNSCKGFEWNPKYYDNINICCPYRTIKDYIPRHSDKILGKFYEKKI